VDFRKKNISGLYYNLYRNKKKPKGNTYVNVNILLIEKHCTITK